MKKISKISVCAVLAFSLIQLIPVKRTNPAVQEEVPASPEVRSVLQRACYDCHSNETRWPWYSRIAPASWLVAHDVREGREKLNFSTWNLFSAKKQTKAFREIREEVEESEMPPWIYLLPHPDARLSERDRAILVQWADSGH
jgi:hypothetical protein